MTFPLKELIEFDGNIYEVTCATIKRAYQLARIQSPEDDKTDKIVSLAARQILTHEVEYQIENRTEFN